MQNKRLLSKEELERKYNELTALTVMEQTKVFLKGFVLEFQGNFEELMDLATQWGNFYGVSTGGKGNLGGEAPGLMIQFEAHQFLEKRGETLTVTALRENLKEITLPDKQRKVAFIEYLIWKFHKTLQELFAPPAVPPEALAALENAISEYEKALAVRRARNAEMEELERVAAGGGVKGMAAKNRLEQMRSEDQLEQNKKEILSAAAKRKAQKVVDDSEAREKEREVQRQAGMVAEEQRLAEEKRKKEAEEAKQKEESRQRLKSKASLWN